MPARHTEEQMASRGAVAMYYQRERSEERVTGCGRVHAWAEARGEEWVYGRSTAAATTPVFLGSFHSERNSVCLELDLVAQP